MKKLAILLICIVFGATFTKCVAPEKSEKPNVILIITDDQGFGDLGYCGNPHIKTTASHFDIFPTIAEICGGEIPTDRKIDGVSLLPLLKDEQADLPDRLIGRYWTRTAPEKYKNMMIRNDGYKLVGNCDETAGIEGFELFSMANDPYELNNIVESNKDVARELKTEMENWLAELLASPNMVHPPRMVIGTQHENPSMLNLNDVHFTAHEDVKKEVAYWEAEIFQSGSYELNLYFKENIEKDCEVQLLIGEKEHSFFFEKPMRDQLSLGKLDLCSGEVDIIPVIIIKEEGKSVYKMPFYVEVKKDSD